MEIIGNAKHAKPSIILANPRNATLSPASLYFYTQIHLIKAKNKTFTYFGTP